MDGTARAFAVAARTVPVYQALGGLAFVYGQGSVVVGFATDADLDLICVWDRAEPPVAAVRPVHRLHTGTPPPAQFDRPGFALDQFWFGRQQVDVAHVSRTIFDGWLASVAAGGGWEGRAYPQPLAAVAGFAYGVLLADLGGGGAQARAGVTDFPQALTDRSREHLAAHLSAYTEALAGCADRGDGWLFHEILGDALRPALVAWFAAHRRYLPFHKRLHHWIARFGLDPAACRPGAAALAAGRGSRPQAGVLCHPGRVRPRIAIRPTVSTMPPFSPRPTESVGPGVLSVPQNAVGAPVGNARFHRAIRVCSHT